jgi:hypothetical protein
MSAEEILELLEANRELSEPLVPPRRTKRYYLCRKIAAALIPEELLKLVYA